MKRWLNRETLLAAAILLFLLIFAAGRRVSGAEAGMGIPAAWIAALLVLLVRKNGRRKDDES